MTDRRVSAELSPDAIQEFAMRRAKPDTDGTTAGSVVTP
jgi:hypothetical protein